MIKVHRVRTKKLWRFFVFSTFSLSVVPGVNFATDSFPADEDCKETVSGSLSLVASDFGERGFTGSICEAVRMAMSTVGDAAGLLAVAGAGAFGASTRSVDPERDALLGACPFRTGSARVAGSASGVRSSASLRGSASTSTAEVSLSVSGKISTGFLCVPGPAESGVDCASWPGCDSSD